VRTAPADNLALHLALEQAAPGDVLVVDAGGVPCGSWGEVLTAAAEQRGVLGLVIDGGVRDVDRLAARRFPAFSRFVAVRRTSKHDPGSVGAPIVVAGRPVERGDAVVADVDGIVVIPQALVGKVVDAAVLRVAKEDGYFREILAGASTVDLLSLRETRVESPRV
jgi:4-hydroxy-4-methyl-2-oxoglutarate aldolase